MTKQGPVRIHVTPGRSLLPTAGPSEEKPLLGGLPKIVIPPGQGGTAPSLGLGHCILVKDSGRLQAVYREFLAGTP